MHRRYVYFANERLSPAELSAARLDGHLVELGEGYIPADAVETAGLRAASLESLVGDLLAATHLTAAWVHGAVDDPPVRHSVQRAVPWRIHHVIDHRLVYRDTALDPRDLALVGGVLVTTRTRTAADLARLAVTEPDRAPEAEAAMRRLVDAPGAARDAIVRLAQQESVPGKPAALELLRRLEREAATTT